MPSDAPAATDTAPVAASSVTPEVVDETKDSVTLPSVAVVPSSVSLTRTLAIAIPPLRGADPLSSFAWTTNRTTVTVTVPSSQLAGLASSQIR